MAAAARGGLGRGCIAVRSVVNRSHGPGATTTATIASTVTIVHPISNGRRLRTAQASTGVTENRGSAIRPSRSTSTSSAGSTVTAAASAPASPNMPTTAKSRSAGTLEKATAAKPNRLVAHAAVSGGSRAAVVRRTAAAAASPSARAAA